MAKNNKKNFFYVLYSDKTRVFDQKTKTENENLSKAKTKAKAKAKTFRCVATFLVKVE